MPTVGREGAAVDVPAIPDGGKVVGEPARLRLMLLEVFALRAAASASPSATSEQARLRLMLLEVELWVELVERNDPDARQDGGEGAGVCLQIVGLQPALTQLGEGGIDELSEGQEAHPPTGA